MICKDGRRRVRKAAERSSQLSTLHEENLCDKAFALWLTRCAHLFIELSATGY